MSLLHQFYQRKRTKCSKLVHTPCLLPLLGSKTSKKCHNLLRPHSESETRFHTRPQVEVIRKKRITVVRYLTD
ncbi:hypothetical protein NC651_002827 [Populus alba x Populus x berolinensis]|nr:hypothetical protein NC651_002827 [Populus alba x Populus x berolinensis]